MAFGNLLRAGYYSPSPVLYILKTVSGTGSFSLHHRVQTGSGVRLASYTMGTRGSFPGGKAGGS